MPAGIAGPHGRPLLETDSDEAEVVAELVEQERRRPHVREAGHDVGVDGGRVAAPRKFAMRKVGPAGSSNRPEDQ